MDFIHLILLHLILLIELTTGERSTTVTTTTLSTSPSSSSETPRKSHASSSELALNIFSKHDSRSSPRSFQESLQQDERRLQSIHERIERATGRKPPRDHRDRNLLSAQVSSGLTLGSGDYFVRLGVGTPPRLYYLEIDTGSDLTWLQCLPCTSCYSQYDPIYEPRNSSSYRQVYCGSSVCQSLEFTSCSGLSCSYQVTYGDRSTTRGELGLESFTMNNNSLRSIAFGCGHSNSGLFQGPAGLLGLGGGALSFVSQLASTAFSYCLVSRYSDLQTSSPLVLGPTSIPFSARFTPLLRNPMISTFYYAQLRGISVGGSLLPIPPSTFDLTGNGTGGVVIDSGTAVTRLVPAAYAVMRDAYRLASQNLPSAPGVYLLDTCYNFQGLPTVQIPSVVLHLGNGVDMALPGNNILVPVDRSGTFCLAFAQSNYSISVIGNIQQQTYRIAFDLQSSLIGIAPRQC